MDALYELRLQVEPALVAMVVLAVPVSAGLVFSSIFRRSLPLWASILWALLLPLAGIPLSEILGRTMPWVHLVAWIVGTGLVGASTATSLSSPRVEGPWVLSLPRAALVGLCAAPGLVERVLTAPHPVMDLGWPLAVVALIWASARSDPGACAARRDAGALLIAAGLGAWAAGITGPVSALSFALAGALGGWRPERAHLGCMPVIGLVYAGNLQWLADLSGSPLEAELYAKWMGPLALGTDMSGRPALDRDWRKMPRRWIGFSLDRRDHRAVLAAGAVPLSTLGLARYDFTLLVQENNELFELFFQQDPGYGVLIERLDDGRIGVAGLPAHAYGSKFHADLRAAMDGCKASHGGVMLDPTQGWTVQEIVNVCISARNLLGPSASCTLQTQRLPGCRHTPELGWRPVCQNFCTGRSLETWEVSAGAQLTLLLDEAYDGHVICPAGQCKIRMVGEGVVDLDCPDNSCELMCEQHTAQQDGALWRCSSSDGLTAGR